MNTDQVSLGTVSAPLISRGSGGMIRAIACHAGAVAFPSAR